MSTIAQQLAALAQIKADIKAAIEAKGVTVGSVAFDEYADLIASISSGGYSTEDIKNLITRGSSLTSFTLPSGITTIGNSAFRACSGLTSITIPSSVTNIATSAFQSCTGLTSITIPSSVTTLGESAFESCSNLTSVTIASGVTSLSNRVFRYCSKVSSLVIPDTVTTIGNNCFENMGALISITLSTNLVSMGQQCFNACGNLTSVDIPAGVSSLAANFFTNCLKLGTIIVRSTTPPTVVSSTFNTSTGKNATGERKLYVPYGCSSAYNTSYWASMLLDSTKCKFTIAELDANGNIPT